MRIRKLGAMFCVMCILAGCFILYVVMDLGFSQEKTKPAPDLEYSKWEFLSEKVHRMEAELDKSHKVVKNIREMIKQMDAHEEREEDKAVLSPPKEDSKERRERESKVVVDEPPRQKIFSKFDQATCPVQKTSVPKTDIQMLSMYDRIMFDDLDGGVWKQGWDIRYESNQWNQKHKLKVFIVPHSHNDPGWLKKFEEYYKTSTRAIFQNMVAKLPEGSGRRFVWAETSYLALWWETDATAEEKKAFENLLKAGNIEVVTGGWVMNDEANSHWMSVAQQLTQGHQWLLKNLNYLPKNAWSIDPFGYSSSQPYLLKLAGFENSVIQRVHYRVKKELAQHKQLEFKWRQTWDGVGKTDMFTHMMPFYSYDVPHTCGPDPKVCCQFDFMRFPGSGVRCPWGVAPLKIIEKNVRERSNLILDQWRKKAQLYRSNVVLVPLGDDFRYDTRIEWDNQYSNYEKLIDYINNEDSWNAEVQFGTLQDYFKAVHEETKMADMPSLSGDFFTYADRNQHYWSGYYTSRPAHKNMDRVLLGYVRAAEIITSQALFSGVVDRVISLQLRDKLETARRALALFQHHDGITGTARDAVKEDYAEKMLAAIEACQATIQQSAYNLLGQPQIVEQTQKDIYFEVDDIWWHNNIPTRITLAIDYLSPAKRVVLYNPLTFRRQQVVSVFVTNPNVEVFDPEGQPMTAQVSPAVSTLLKVSLTTGKFELSFLATVDPLSMAVYTVKLREENKINKYTSFAKVRVINADYWSVDLPEMFAVETTPRLNENITIQAGNSTRVVTDANGLIRAIVTRDGKVTPVHMEFVHYGSQKGQDNNSGAYLFLPDGPARAVKASPYPEAVLISGPVKATLSVAYVAEHVATITPAITVYNNPSLPHAEVEITNTFLLDPAADNLELAMRFSTVIANGDEFFTDSNAMQMIKRKRFSKLPLQANFYPLPSAAYIQDDAARLTLLTSTPLGVAALKPGQIEIMHDRRLSKDDNRGLNQGITDNVQTRHTFRLLLEPAAPCQAKTPPEHPSGQLTLGAHVSQQSLLQPVIVMHYADAAATAAPSYKPYSDVAMPGADVVLAAYHGFVNAKDKSGAVSRGAGLTFQRVFLETCYGDGGVAVYYPPGSGQVYLPHLTPVLNPDQMFESTLTFNQIKEPIPDGILNLCPMEIRSVFLKKSADTT
ncbi:hypothetical protein JYU34_018854 [Plutella xylostella]|uniref:Alpha-mannosidase n=1 Tax=Plutella xylostella TaxID=51655 RepID=A0ABQ7Q043_PLUXY|nr:hypothetical protein JYU34_018854 [Plutella xylostella]